MFPYRLGWYAPLIGSYLDPTPTAPSSGPGSFTPERIAKAAKRYCNGISFGGTNPLMVRVDAFRADASAPPIDWNANNVQNALAAPQDLNFDGDTNGVLGPFDDWANIRLNQVGQQAESRRLLLPVQQGRFRR